MQITLNLATRPYADLRPALKRLRIAMAALAVVALALTLGLHAFHQKAMVARATEQRVQGQIDAINQERQSYQDLMHQPVNAQLLSQVATLNQLFAEKTFSWTLAMEDLETVLPAGVQVTTLEPVRDTKTGTITLKLRVVGPRDLGDDLVQNLEHSRHFLLPHIVGESAEATGGPNERVEPVNASNRFTFEILADYNPAAPIEHRTKARQQEMKLTAAPEHGGAGAIAPHRANRPPAVPAAAPQSPGRPLSGRSFPGNANTNRRPNPGGPQ